MTFQLSAIFLRSDPPITTPTGFEYCSKMMDAPFRGTAILLRLESHPKIPEAEIAAILEPLAVGDADWLYVEYCTWAGTIDSVRSFGIRNGAAMTSFDEEVLERNRSTYLQLMAEFGVSEEDALDFPPFRRGWWEH